MASKKSLPMGNRRKHEQVSGCKKSQGRSAESWLYSKSGQTRNTKEGWETKSQLKR